MAFFQWVIAVSVLATVVIGGARFFHVTQQQIQQQQQSAADKQRLIERYRLQHQLQRHRHFLMMY
ncbi:hypothetical protein [Pseudidiomarina donghaiensis]|uniref:Uncharacterized protein n=1 Tax=Pseudidiomarina donghaiensis TaxID=519452 RepID=A0A432XLB0_9GAMM|nr:hypothetical protein [Pseudidiomarina donghaiensis]RUO49479.1 hypothetical protein CWE24_02975 [Pseudidiomarina donghaiensis]SFV21326.1 hypothetical protein SAMN04488139_0731 [Pseudidiomarina donghaiensis]